MSGTRPGTRTAAAAAPLALPSRVRQFYTLTKPRVVQLIVFCAVIGMLLAEPGWPEWRLLIPAALGIWLVAAAAAAFNCLVEQQIDARMARTAWRPTARGELGRGQTLLFATLLCVAGCVVLLAWVNALTMWLTLATFVGYAIVYTVVLKPATPQNIVIGGASGAMPPLLGWAAMRGEVGAEAWLMVLIIFVWTPPHFWALALYRAEDYARAGLPMLPVTHGSDFTRLQILLYTVLLLVVSVLPFVTRMSGPFYLVGALLLGAGFLWYAIQMMQGRDVAMKTFGYSIWYLVALFAILLVDHYLPLLF